jgi:ornithine--oxo-acid transaminase
MISRVFTKNLVSYSSKQVIDIEAEFGCHNYGPLPVVASKGKGALLWDVEGTFFITFQAMNTLTLLEELAPAITVTAIRKFLRNSLIRRRN